MLQPDRRKCKKKIMPGKCPKTPEICAPPAVMPKFAFKNGFNRRPLGQGFTRRAPRPTGTRNRKNPRAAPRRAGV
jgi:hypothetical protein